MKTLVTIVSAAAVLLLATASAASARPPQPAAASCAGQLLVNPGFERGPAGWTAGPRIVVLGDETRPAHTGRAFATFGGLDVTRSDLLRATVPVPAGCKVTLTYWTRGTTTETTRGDYLNVGLSVTGIPPKTLVSLAYDTPSTWQQRTSGAWTAPADGTATVSFYGSETAGNGTTAFDVDDVTLTLS
jgi:hypothetical protein